MISPFYPAHFSGKLRLILAAVTVYPSPTFYRWVFGWGWDGSIVIVGPEDVKAQYRKMLRKADQEEKKAKSPEALAKRVERTEKPAMS